MKKLFETARQLSALEPLLREERPTGRVDRGSGLARVLGEGSVLGVRGRDETLGALDGGVGAVESVLVVITTLCPFGRSSLANH
jgi:hypothetical protein